MEKRRAVLATAAATAAMLLLVAAVLLASFWAAIYADGSYRFYEKEYQKYTVADALDMEPDDVMEVTAYMMDYLIGREDVLSIQTDVDGAYQDFFNEQDRLHMADVRNLFLGGLSLMRVLFIVALGILFALWLKKRGGAKLYWRAYRIALCVFVLLMVALGIACSIDFTRCFTIFHQIFFTNDLWMFDPEKDYMIRMLPEGFFLDMVIRIAKFFAAGLAVLGVGLYLRERAVDKKQRQTPESIREFG